MWVEDLTGLAKVRNAFASHQLLCVFLPRAKLICGCCRSLAAWTLLEECVKPPKRVDIDVSPPDAYIECLGSYVCMF